MRLTWAAIAIGTLILLASGCQDRAKVAPHGVDKLYDVKGTVVEIGSSGREVILDHEDIPGLMRAMKMSFAVEDPKLLDGLKAGDKVVGKLRSKDGEHVLTELKKQGP